MILNKHMEKYIILKAKSADALATIVNASIDAGYQVNGSPVSTAFNWYQ